MNETSKPKTPLVIADLGSCHTKCGFAGDKHPRSVFPTVVGCPKSSTTIRGSNLAKYYVGKDAISQAHILRLIYPLERTSVADWNSLEIIIKHIYKEELLVSPKDCPLLITGTFLSKNNMIRLAEFLFETLNVPGVYFCSPYILVLYAVGRATGLMIESGDGVTSIVPIVEGFMISRATTIVNLAGKDITNYLAKLLAKHGLSFSTAEMGIVRDIKEKLCYFAMDYEEELRKAKKNPKAISKSYKLPDGRIVELVEERFTAPEIMYNPTLIDSKTEPLNELVLDTILRCDIDLRPAMFTIIASGGNVMTPNFAERLRKELDIIFGHTKQKISIEIPNPPIYGTFIGASIVASSHQFRENIITRKEWSEAGSGTI